MMIYDENVSYLSNQRKMSFIPFVVAITDVIVIVVDDGSEMLSLSLSIEKKYGN